jgi:hypothetical protein
MKGGINNMEEGEKCANCHSSPCTCGGDSKSDKCSGCGNEPCTC